MNKSFLLTDWVRPNIQELTSYTSARDQYGQDQGILLDANELGLGPAIPGTDAGHSVSTNTLHRYPDPYQRELRTAIAQLRGVHADQVFTGNGSDEAIDLIIRLFCEPAKHRILCTPPTYGMYKVSARIHDIAVDQAPLNPNFSLHPKAIIEAISPETRVLFLCSPNNPTGTMANESDLRYLCEHAGCLVVIDEAYIDFSEAESMAKSLEEFPNLIVLQTLSKSFGLAGIRLGIALASKEIIAYFDKIKAPYNVNSLSAQVALSALQKPEIMRAKVKEILLERAYVTERLELLKQILNSGPISLGSIFPSQANFVLFQIDEALRLQQELAKQKVIVRYRGNELHSENSIRLSIGSRDENNLFFETLLTVLGYDGPAYKSMIEQLDLQPKHSALDQEDNAQNSKSVQATNQNQSPRKATIRRHTNETRIDITLNLDGTGAHQISTGLRFFDHMLEQIARHGLIDLDIQCQGDLHIDEHHTIEDVGIALGQALSQAYGDKRGIDRYGFVLPMDEARATVALDLSGRPYLVFNGSFDRVYVGDVPTDMVEHFFYSLATHMQATLHIDVLGDNDHHKVEACFKGLARALKQATEHNPRISGQVPSSKGSL
jgi:histidinol-phosphate aminotransferase/imidazoleglycerol-phosphate dehydratase/histidinol-phosphatase